MGRCGGSVQQAWLCAALATAACTTEKTDAEFSAEIDGAIHDQVNDGIAAVLQAARDLQAASPNHAWRPLTSDAAEIADMRAAWLRTRFAYERTEGAIKAVFPELDAALDARYEEALARLGSRGDRDLFDGRGVTGMHAIERILFAPVIRRDVIAYERTLDGYVAAAYPASDGEAVDFKTGLVQRMIDDAESLGKQWRAATTDLGAAYCGQVGLMIEQPDKVDRAVTGEEESRYANITLADLRNNLGGAQQVYELFRDWIRSKATGAPSDSKIQARFDALAQVYATVATTSSDALPAVPPGWSPDAPTAEDLATPFGTVWQAVHDSADPDRASSMVFEMKQVAALLGLPGHP